ncbi:GtrA family protein [Catellatospora vulcania]|uniref:GtrA family protein n=1 Tax=Catellatospora vulcania TaxID=1460450 RepID=UPI0018AF8D76|nr:GtrA family protein [Catellatospora vulcania]
MSALFRRWHWWRFAAVGVVCFGAQTAVLVPLERAGMAAAFANATGFWLSAQLNFVLSSLFTWRDRPARGTRAVLARWWQYQGMAYLSLAMNSLVFVAAEPVTGQLSASAIGVLIGACFSYAVSKFLIFRPARATALPPAAHREEMMA